MSFFQGAHNVSIERGTFNTVTGNQTNNHIYNEIVQQKKKRTLYDEFYEIKLGGVHRIRDIHCENYPRQWDVGIRKRLEEGRFRVDRTICAAKIRDEQGSSFTVVSYSGPEKKKAWKEDFRQFSKTTDTTNMQLFGINRSSTPLLIFYGELVPLAHLWDRLGDLGRGYAWTLSLTKLWKSIGESAVWIDPAQGTLVRGVNGPDCRLFHPTFFSVRASLPSSVELLDEDVCFRYLSRLPLDKEFDREVIDVISFGSMTRVTIDRPCVLSGKTNSTIAVGSGVWIEDGCLADGVMMPDGRIRCILREEDDSDLILYIHHNPRVWHSQASSVFYRLGISLNDDLSSYELILPDIELIGYVYFSRQRSEDRPIYFFLHPHSYLPLEDDSVLSTHTWSFDENGQTSIPHCKNLGLPTELRVCHRPTDIYYWPSRVYKLIHKWQIERGFDPTTTNFARYLEYPIYEVRPPRFEELGVDQPEESYSFDDDLYMDSSGQPEESYSFDDDLYMDSSDQPEESYSFDDDLYLDSLPPTLTADNAEDLVDVDSPTSAFPLQDGGNQFQAGTVDTMGKDVGTDSDSCFEGYSTSSTSDMEVE